MKLEEQNSFGVVTACHAGDYHFVKATCASVKHFCPDVPLCVIVDGDFNIDELIETYHPYILRTTEVKDVAIKTYCSGSPLAKHLAMWVGPFERYIYLDSDAIFWGNVIDTLKWENDEDFIVFWDKPREPAHNSWLSHFYFDIDIIKQYDPDFEWKWNPYFSAGTFAARRGAISFFDFQKCELWRSEHASLFSWTTDQGILNYLVFALSQRKQLKIGSQDLQWIPRHKGTYETIQKLSIRSWSLPDSVQEPCILHFCGSKPYVHISNSYSLPLTLSRLKHQKNIGSNYFLALLEVAKEECIFLMQKILKKYHLFLSYFNRRT